MSRNQPIPIKMVLVFIASWIALNNAATFGQTARTDYKLYFGRGPAPDGFTAVAPKAEYSKTIGFGYETIDKPATQPAADPSNPSKADIPPFYFSVAEPEENFEVTVTLGNAQSPTTTTIKAELRRLMLESIHTDAGQFVTRSFIVNVRTPRISTGGSVHLKAPRENTTEAWAWDDKLTLEFNDQHPGLVSLEIHKVDVPTVFLLGDSTVCDQPVEPYCSWGQMLPRFFEPDIAVANHAESGETVASSNGAHRFEKVMSLMRPGDFLLIQFGHNDMKSKSPTAADDYRKDIESWIQQTKLKGGQAIVVTPMNRHTFQGNMVTNSLQDYPDMARTAAKNQGAALIDLNAMSKTMYEAEGPQGSLELFEHSPDFSQKDATHHSPYGAYELAKCIITGIQQTSPALAGHIAKDFPKFDPAKPDGLSSFKIPPSPNFTNTRPLGD